ncbi:MAG: EamA family transporter, partial [Sphingobacteriia bacterium]|nr:EamA family transporter [Sphingobacteriia bacterium]
IISMSPVFTMLFAHVIVNEKFTKRKAMALLLNIIGLIIVANPVNVLHGSAVSGILIVFAACIAFGLYTAMGKKRIANIGGMSQNSFSFLLGSAILLVILLATGSPVIEGIQPDNIPLLLYLGVFVTGLGYFCYLKAIELSGPSTASITFFIKPVFAPIIAFAVLKEAITMNVIFGILFVLAGSFISLTGNKKLNEDKEPVA